MTGRGAHLRITAEADGYLYKMVRSLVGALVAVGQGKLTPAEVDAILRWRTVRTRSRRRRPTGCFSSGCFIEGEQCS